jgi:hypothetical protein
MVVLFITDYYPLGFLSCVPGQCLHLAEQDIYVIPEDPHALSAFTG